MSHLDHFDFLLLAVCAWTFPVTSCKVWCGTSKSMFIVINDSSAQVEILCFNGLVTYCFSMTN